MDIEKPEGVILRPEFDSERDETPDAETLEQGAETEAWVQKLEQEPPPSYSGRLSDLAERHRGRERLRKAA